MTNLVPKSSDYMDNVVFYDISKTGQNMEKVNVLISTRNENYIFNVK